MKDATCNHCGRLVPAGVYTCIGCGAPRMGKIDEVKNVTVDMSGLTLTMADFGFTVEEFTRGMMKAFNRCANEHANIILVEDANETD